MLLYTQAPLPFTGQKRNFLKHYINLLNQNIPDQGDGWTIVDVFGGSGLLSHVSKHIKPNARVVYNDFDGYVSRLGQIEATNKLRQALFAILADYPRNKHIDVATKNKIISVINEFDGYKDLDCLASWLLFSGSQAASLDDLFSKHMYNCIRKNDYPSANGYLDNIDIRSQSFEQLLPPFLTQEKTLLVLDPPYICTAQNAYRRAGYFGMVQFLKLMATVRPPFIFFSSTRSELIDYLDLVIDDKMQGWEGIADYQKISVNVRLNKTAGYEDNLVYKF